MQRSQKKKKQTNRRKNPTPIQILAKSCWFHAILFLFFFFAIIYLVFPIDYQPAVYQPGPIPDYSAYHRPLKSFKNLELISFDKLRTPEDLEVDQQNGDIYTGLHDGTIVKINEKRQWIEIAKSTGSVLGVKLNKNKNELIFIDLKIGLCKLQLNSGKIEVLTNSYANKAFNFLNNFDIAENGKIYFSQSSSKYTQPDFLIDFLEGKPYGSVYSYDPNTKITQKLIDNLYFPNGIAVSPDQKSLFIAETYRNRILKYHLEGEKKEQTQIFIENLPGTPDNLKSNKKGELLIGLPVFRDAISDLGAKNYWVKTFLSYLPRITHDIISNAKYTGGLIVKSEDGSVIAMIKQTRDQLYYITSLVNKGNKLYLGSLKNNVIVVLDIE